MPMKIILATKNKGKISEMRKILGSAGMEILSLADLPPVELPEESGHTFTENAVAKAIFVAEKFGLSALADDSGLEVEALGGRPGVRSARYAGEGASDEDNFRRLLFDMKDVPAGMRQARFVCVIALARPNEPTKTFEGVFNGEIAEAPAGANGFGYDPVFHLTQRRCTVAELAPEEKNAISHRAAALAQLKTWLGSLA